MEFQRDRADLLFFNRFHLCAMDIFDRRDYHDRDQQICATPMSGLDKFSVKLFQSIYSCEVQFPP